MVYLLKMVYLYQYRFQSFEVFSSQVYLIWGPRTASTLCAQRSWFLGKRFWRRTVPHEPQDWLKSFFFFEYLYWYIIGIYYWYILLIYIYIIDIYIYNILLIYIYIYIYYWCIMCIYFFPWSSCVYTYIYIYIEPWRFPKSWGYPLNHPFVFVRFSSINHPTIGVPLGYHWGTTFEDTSMYIYCIYISCVCTCTLI